MSVKPIIVSEDIGNTSIIKGNVAPSKVYDPQWINNQTRLNQTNVELMRSNIIRYIDSIARDLYKTIKNDYNNLVKKGAGWVDFDINSDLETEIYGEVFNDYENNSVSHEHTYQATFGTYTQANGDAQFVCGKYNDEVENALFIVGCGTDTIVRENAIVVNEDGSVHILTDVTYDGKQTFTGTKVTIKNDLEVGGKLIASKKPTAKNHVVRKQELDELRSEISGALHYIGKTTTTLTDGSTTNPIAIYDAESGETSNITAVAGDVVIINGTQNEFIFDGKSWTDYSAYGNYVLTKTYEDEQDKLNKAAFGNEITPTSGDSLQAQISANKMRLDELDNTYATDQQLADAVKTERDERKQADSDNLLEAKDYVDEQNIFETDIVTVEKFGGIDAGVNLNGMTTHEILRTLLYPYIAFVINSSSRSAAAGTLENGVTQTLSSATISITKKSKPITSVKLMNGSTVLEEKTGDAVANGGTIKFEGLGITVSKDNNPNLTFTVTDGQTFTDKSVGASTFVYPYYMGECAADATIDETLIKGLTKNVASKGNKTVTHSCENGRMIIAYPKAHGVLKSILDPNNFETIGDYTRSEVSITGLDSTTQTYYVYASGAATVSDFKVQYKY